MDILDKYDEARRQVFRDIVDPISSANLRRIWNEPESIRWTDPFFNKARRAATEPEILEEMKLVGNSAPFLVSFLLMTCIDEHQL